MKTDAMDRVRQVVVTLAAVFMIIGTLFGIGVIGTRVEESSGGSLSATATLLAPAVPAFSIWSVIYVGLVAYVIWQWLPANTGSSRARRIGWLAAVSMVLNGAWLLVTQAGWLWVSVLVILALVATLGELVRRLGSDPSDRVADKIVVDGTFGLYLGWSAVATAANITATLVASGVNPGGLVAELLGVAVVAVAAGIGVVLAVVYGGRWAVAAAMAWGLSWIAVGRLAVEPESALVGGAALAAALIVLGAAALVRLRANRLAPVHVGR
ncbi:TspO/MBR family protein [Propionicimonas paludicola]|nr:TspO/MBR family protein [Propionicimonas paludicola]